MNTKPPKLKVCWISKSTRAQAYVRARASTFASTRACAHTRTQKYVIYVAFPRPQ